MSSWVVRPSRPSRPSRILSCALAAFVATLLSVHGAVAQTATAASAATSPIAPCDTGAYRQFDFWLGRWEVRTPDGQLAGTNHIERLPSGCALRESWTSAGGGHGTSLNFFDRATGEWHQVWVDGRGGVLRLSGRLQAGAMIMVGTAPGADGRPQRQRITWTPIEGGRVRQHWETSADGERWQTAFDGTYAPARSP